MDTLIYLTLEYLTYLLLAVAAGGVALLCAVLVMAGAALGRWMSERWQGFHQVWQHFAVNHLVPLRVHLQRRM